MFHPEWSTNLEMEDDGRDVRLCKDPCFKELNQPIFLVDHQLDKLRSWFAPVMFFEQGNPCLLLSNMGVSYEISVVKQNPNFCKIVSHWSQW